MTTLDLAFVRSQFPAFAEPSLAGFAHFENAGGSFACGQVIAALDRFYRETKVQPYYAFEPSARAGARNGPRQGAHGRMAQRGPDELHLGPSTSQNTYVLAQAFRRHLQRGDEVIVTNQDHEANIGAWSRLQDDGIVVRTWQVDASRRVARRGSRSAARQAHACRRLHALLEPRRHDPSCARDHRSRASCRRAGGRGRGVVLPARPAGRRRTRRGHLPVLAL